MRAILPAMLPARVVLLSAMALGSLSPVLAARQQQLQLPQQVPVPRGRFVREALDIGDVLAALESRRATAAGGSAASPDPSARLLQMLRELVRLDGDSNSIELRAGRPLLVTAQAPVPQLRAAIEQLRAAPRRAQIEATFVALPNDAPTPVELTHGVASWIGAIDEVRAGDLLREAVDRGGSFRNVPVVALDMLTTAVLELPGRRAVGAKAAPASAPAVGLDRGLHLECAWLPIAADELMLEVKFGLDHERGEIELRTDALRLMVGGGLLVMAPSERHAVAAWVRVTGLTATEPATEPATDRASPAPAAGVEAPAPPSARRR